MINIKSFCCNPFRENCFLVWDEKGTGVIIDPGFYNDEELKVITDYIFREKITVQAIWLTHGHFDHIYGVASLVKDYVVPVLMSQKDKEVLADGTTMPERFTLRIPEVGFKTEDLSEGEELRVGGNIFTVIETPGHTPGCVCFYDEADKVLFSGDTLFAGSIGRTDHLGGDYDKEIVSIMDKIMGLPGDVDVLPGHGPKTTIARERTQNPFLQPFNEPQEESLDWDDDGIELHGTD